MGAPQRVLVMLAAAAVTLLGVTACGGGSRPDADDTNPGSDPTATLVARADHELAIYRSPNTEPSSTLAATTEFGSPRALLVLDDQGDWLRVALPERPNGSSGWIRRGDVELRVVDEAITIDLEARSLTFTDGGQEVLTTTVAIGTPEAPTPMGDFYVVDKLATGETNGDYGPFALGLSAHSEVLTEFAGGDGQVGLHGTNDPASIGLAVSHGCIRVPNDVIETLNQLVPLGTPVTIA